MKHNKTTRARETYESHELIILDFKKSSSAKCIKLFRIFGSILF